MAFNPATNTIAPRSIVNHLKERIALLEDQKSSPYGGLPPTSSTAESIHGTSASARLTSGNSAAGIALHDITSSSLGLTETILLAECAVTATRVPVADQASDLSDLHENHPRSILNQQPSELPLTSIPLQVAEFLLTTYTTRVIAPYPIYSTLEIQLAFDQVYRQPNGAGSEPYEATPRSTYIASLIMAISLSTSARNQQA